jgi:imidazole glycerol phosphate synthase subunit HisF
VKSTGSDAVYAAKQYYPLGHRGDSTNAIETMAHVYGSQAVVISVDPKKVYVNSLEDAPTHHVIQHLQPSPNGERYFWYQCTVSSRRKGRDLDVRQLAIACQASGDGEIMFDSMDLDGMKQGYDLALIQDASAGVTIPFLASSDRRPAQHFVEVFEKTGAEAATAAGGLIMYSHTDIPYVHMYIPRTLRTPLEEAIDHYHHQDPHNAGAPNAHSEHRTAKMRLAIISRGSRGSAVATSI